MTAPWRDRNYISIWTFLRGLFTLRRACTLCGSTHVSRSHTKFGGIGGLLGLVAMRCRACGKRFSLRSGVAGPSGRHGRRSA